MTPGFYRVEATRQGCRATRGKRAITPVLEVPPPRLGLSIKLKCPNLHRRASTTRLRAKRTQLGGVALRANVKAPGRQRDRLAGTVAFEVGGKSVGSVIPNPKTGVAALTVASSVTRGVVRATFSGNAYVAASRGRAKLKR